MYLVVCACMHSLRAEKTNIMENIIKLVQQTKEAAQTTGELILVLDRGCEQCPPHFVPQH